MAWAEVCAQLDSLLAGFERPADKAWQNAAADFQCSASLLAREGPEPSAQERERLLRWGWRAAGIATRRCGSRAKQLGCWEIGSHMTLLCCLPAAAPMRRRSNVTLTTSLLCCTAAPSRRSLSSAGEQLAALDSTLVQPGQHQRTMAVWQLVSGCAALASICGGLPAADALRFCQHSLHLLLGRGTAHLKHLLQGSAQPAPTQRGQQEVASAPAAGQAQHALAEAVSHQATALRGILRLAAARGWFAMQGATAVWCPPDMLATWVAAAVQALRELDLTRGSTGGCRHVAGGARRLTF